MAKVTTQNSAQDLTLLQDTKAVAGKISKAISTAIEFLMRPYSLLSIFIISQPILWYLFLPSLIQ